MDFVVGLPHAQIGHDAIWVIMDRLTKSHIFWPFVVPFLWRDWSSCTSMRLSNFMEYLYQLCQIRILSSHINSGLDFRRLWILPCTLALFFTLKLMVNLKRPSRLWKTCFGHVYWSSRIAGGCICFWLNLHTTTVIRPVLS